MKYKNLAEVLCKTVQADNVLLDSLENRIQLLAVRCDKQCEELEEYKDVVSSLRTENASLRHRLGKVRNAADISDME